MHFFSDVYVTLISQSVHPLWGVKTSAGWGKHAKCVNITLQMALTAAALLQTSRLLVCNLFSRRIGAVFSMLSRRAGLSASAGLSCTLCQPHSVHSSRFTSFCAYHLITVTTFALTIYLMLPRSFTPELKVYLFHKSFPP